MTTFDTIAAERRALAARLSEVPDDRWSTPSLCDGWTVRHVLAHLVTPFLVSTPRMIVYAVKGRGFPGAMDLAARDIADRHSVEQMIELLRVNADSTFTPPGAPPEAPLTDVVCHGADIWWSLDAPTDRGAGDPARLAPMLDFLAGPKARGPFVPRGRLDGLRLVATDQQWSTGDGAEVRGPSLALAMGMLGRPAAEQLLDGDGVARLFS